MIIDGHTHGVHGRTLDQLGRAGGDWASRVLASLVVKSRERPHLADVPLRLEMLDRNGIDLQVVTPHNALDSNLLPGDVAAQLDMARAINDNMARLMDASQGRLLAAGSIPLTEFERGGSKEMRRAIETLGLKAISIPSNIRGRPLDLPEFDPFWAQAVDRDVPVYIHPHDPISYAGRSYEAEYDLGHIFGWPYETVLMLSRLVFSGMMEKYPTLKIVSHHLGGGMIPFFWGRITETYSLESLKNEELRSIGRVFPKPLFDYFSKFYFDTAVGGCGPAIRCAYEVFGADQIIFATDTPWGPGTGESRLATYPSQIRALGFSEEDNQKIFEGNIRRILNLT